MNFVFLGQQGAGKGTFAQHLSEKKGLIQISAGDLLRAEVKAETNLGKKVKEIMNAGELVSDELIAEMIEKRIKEVKEKGFILDGYPRTLKQAELLEGIMQKLNLKIDAAVNFTIGDATTIERLGGRRTCKNCNKVYHIKYLPPKITGKCDACGGELITRDDDKPEAIKKRLEAYKKQTKPLIDYYKEKGLLKEIDAEPKIEEIKPVFDKIIEEIENKKITG
ncbi:adenylate kinase [Candidatus Micrarchaeota archaeon]|nr:adenylate kinase [Candidatus Micrarchaeota archaeon]MBU2476235.1 adenylate kinase [Candidatus Micrarchaeota archaeon]